MYPEKQFITIYTDGACSPNPGSGGWAAVLLFDNQEPKTLQGAAQETTNNRMELTAPIEALRTLNDGSSVTVCTDSTYVKDGVTKWLANWQRRGWQTAEGSPVKNKDLWEELAKESERLDVGWRWVKGHGEDKWNLLADQLAVEARAKKRPPEMSTDCIQMFLGVTCSHTTKSGGWATVLTYKEHHKLLGSGVEDVTANTLYLLSLINGLQEIKKDLPICVFTSSGYLVEGASSWLHGWKKRSWQTRDGQEVANKEYWQQLEHFHQKFQVDYQLVDKSHSPCYMQEAKEIAREFQQELPSK